MTSGEVIILAAAVGSLPGWAAVAVSITTKRALPRQTQELKDHIDSTSATAPAEPALTRGDDHVQ